MKQALLLLLLLFILFVKNAWSQAHQPMSIKGRLYDKESQSGISSVTVSCLLARDSSRVRLLFTDNNGEFEIRDLPKNNYILLFTFIGYQSIVHHIKSTVDSNKIEIGNINMKRIGLTLAQVEIFETKSKARVTKDTVEFDAKYFSIPENSLVQDLLKKIPGIQIDKNGNIKVNGESVKTILVNGQPLFGGEDPQLVYENLHAALIDKIQLINSKESENKSHIISNQKNEKIINITIKKNKFDQVTGEISAGYGTEKRFATKVSLSRFRKSQQIVIIGNGDNTNGTLNNSGLGGGLTRKWSGGINYSNDLGNKINVKASYLMNDSKKIQQINSYRQLFLKDSTNYYNKQEQDNEDAQSHVFLARIEFKIDSLQKIVLTNQLGFQINHNLSNTQYESTGLNSHILNNGHATNQYKQTSNSGSSTIYYERKFVQPGRLLSMSVSYGRSDAKESGVNISNTNYLNNTGESTLDSINQFKTVKGNGDQIFAIINFTEPLSKGKFMQFAVGRSQNNKVSDKIVLDYNGTTNKYDIVDDSLNNNFKNSSIQNYGKIGINIQKERYDYTLSLITLSYRMNNINNTLSNKILIHQTAFLPVVNFSYALNNESNLQISYIKGTEFPEMSQIQPIQDNSNPLNIKIGNPSLKSAEPNDFTLSYNSLNTNTLKYFSILINSRITHNQIINSTWLDSIGRQYIQPINSNGGYSLSINMENGFPTKQIKNTVTFTTVAVLNKEINYTNNIKGSNNNLSITQSINLVYSYKKLIDCFISGNINYNNVRYTSQKYNNSKNLNYGLSFNGSLNLPLNFTLNSNLSYGWVTGRASGYNLNTFLLNASISRTLFSNRQGLITLQGFDILRHNTSSSRKIGENFIEDSQSTILQRYFLIKFAYFVGKRN